MNPQTGLMPGQGPQAQQNGNGGNWFTHSLPTVGGILGGLVAGGLDLGTGGLAVAADPAIVGAFTAGGKALENHEEGQKAFQGNDLTAGLEGGAGELGGNLIGAGISKAGGLLTKMGDNVAAKQTAGDIAQAYGDVPKPVQSLYNASDSLGHVKAMGFDPANPQHLVDVANNSNDVLNDTLNGALAKSSPVDLGNYNDLVHSTLSEVDPNGGLLGSTEGTPLAKGGYSVPNSQAGKLVQKLNNMGAGIATKTSDPNALRSLVDNLNGLSQTLAPKVGATGEFDPAQEAAYNLVNGVRDKVSSALYDRPEVNAAIKSQAGNLTAQDVGSQQLADHLNNVITNAGNGETTTGAQDLLSEIGRNQDIAGLGNEGLKAGQIVTSPTAQARMTGGTPSAVNNLMEHPAVQGALAGHAVLSGLASHGVLPAVAGAAKVGKALAGNQRALSTVGRIMNVAGRVAPAAGVVTTTAPNMTPQQSNSVLGGAMQQPNSITGQLPAPQAPQQGLSREDLLTLALYSPSALSALQPSAQQTQNVTAANTALGALSGLGQAPTGGILSQLQGHLGIGATGEYQRKAAAAAQQIAAALPGSNPEAIQKQLTDYAAGGGNIDEAIAALQQNLQGEIQANRQTGLSGMFGVGAGAPQNITSQLPAPAY